MKTKKTTKTRRKRTEETSSLTNKFFKTILDSMNDTISIINVHDFRITAANNVFLKQLKLKEKDVIGRPCYEVTHHRSEPCAPPDGACPLLETLKTGKHSKTEHIHYNSDGEKIYVEVSTSPISNESGKIVQVVHVARNITERKKAEEALSWELRVNSAVAELSSALISTITIGDLSYIVLEKAKSLTDSAFGYVGYIDPHTGCLICPTLTRDIWETCQVAAKDIVFEKFTGLWGWVLENRKSLLTNTPLDDPRSSGTPQGHIPIKRFLSAPALIGEMLVGQVAVANAERDYTERDLEMIERLAALYAVAVQRKWAEKELKKHHDQLEAVVKARTAELTKSQKSAEEEAKISSSLLELATSIVGLLDINSILEEVSKTVLKLTSSEKTAVLLGQDEDGDYKAAVFHGWPEYLTPSITTLRLNKNNMPAINILIKGEDVCIDDAKSTDLMDKDIVETFNLRSLILSPLITGEGLLGIIMAEKQQPFTQRDKTILKGIASSTAIAVENAMLYRESIEMATDLARRMETIKITYEIDRSILSLLNREEILEVMTKNIQRIIPADEIITIQLDEEGRGYFYGSQLIPFGTCTFMDSVLKVGRVISVPDLALHKHPGHIIKDFLRRGFGSLIALPLYTKGKRFGCIVMLSKRVGAFDKEDISNGEKLTAQMSIALENAKLYEDIKDLFISTVRTLAHAIDAKSPWTRGHSERVTAYAISLGKEIGLSDNELEKLELAGLLHDIGKIGTYDTLLEKPEKLTAEEFELVKQHPTKGAEILEPIKQLKDIVPIIKHHHERLDGKGYPDGLKGDEIPFLSRILCVADSFDSMTADRPYRPAPGKEFAIAELKRYSGIQFDPLIVKAFLRVIK
jgi:PAS domain S-box-containing protein/putative nucleotidyltransferase with HDIG domain